MSVARWEYATVIWSEDARKISKTDPEHAQLSPEIQAEWEQKEWAYYWWKSQYFRIWLPDAAEADTRPAWTTGDKDYKTTFVGILNELGAEGWEAVSHMVQTTAMGFTLGRDPAGIPIQTHTLLKRAVG